jgi:uncharacterized membrane protein
MEKHAIRLADFRWTGLLAGASWAFAAWLYGRLPERVPVHWNLAGEPDRWGSPLESVLVVPVVITLLVPLLALLPRLDPRRGSYAAFRGAYVGLIHLIVTFMLVIQVALAAQALQPELNLGRVVVAAIGLLFAGIGFFLPRLRSNWFAGIRTPWTLDDDRVWESTHRFGGRLFVATGVAAAAVAALAPPRWGFGALMVAMVVAALGSVIHSYVVWRSLRAADGAPAA